MKEDEREMTVKDSAKSVLGKSKAIEDILRATEEI